MKYVEMSKQILDSIGGVENLNQVEHCATRLRLHYNSKELVDEEALKGIENVLGVVNKAGQIQVIIGPDVNIAYNDFLEVSGYSEISNDEKKVIEKKTIGYYANKATDFLGGIFIPMMPVLIACGLISAILNAFSSLFNFDTSSGFAAILGAISTAGFYYFPIFLGINTARRLKISPVMGALLGSVLVSQAINGAKGLSVLGIPVLAIAYNNSVFPVILGVILMAQIDRLSDRFMPNQVKTFLKPLLVMIITVPITLLVFGPIGTYLSQYVGEIFTWLTDKIGFLVVGIEAFLDPYVIMFGLDKALAPIYFATFAEKGYEALFYIGGLISAIAIGTTTLTIGFMTKKKELRGLCISAGITSVFGITEPSLYGVLVPHKKALLGTMVGAACGGIFAGLVHLRTYALVLPGLVSVLTYIEPNGGMSNFYFCLITILITICVTVFATRFFLRNYKNL